MELLELFDWGLAFLRTWDFLIIFWRAWWTQIAVLHPQTLRFGMGPDEWHFSGTPVRHCHWCCSEESHRRQDMGLIPESGIYPGEANGNPLQYSCLENPCGQKSLVGYSPWGRKESDMTEHTHSTQKCGSWTSVIIWKLVSNVSQTPPRLPEL